MQQHCILLIKVKYISRDQKLQKVTICQSLLKNFEGYIFCNFFSFIEVYHFKEYFSGTSKVYSPRYVGIMDRCCLRTFY